MPATAPYGLFASKNAPYDNAEEFIKYVKANPGKVRFGFSPLGCSHYAILKLLRGSGLSMDGFRLLPMAGDKNRIVALLQGNMDTTIVTAASGRGYVDSGDMKLIGIMADEKMPGGDYPTLKEQGVDAVEVFKFVAYAPKKTPKDRLEILRTAFSKAANDPEMREEMNKLWIFPAHLGGDTLNQSIDKDFHLYKDLADKFGIVKH